MTMFTIIFITFLVVMAYLFIRLELVASYRRKLIDDISEKTRGDIANTKVDEVDEYDKPLLWRYKEFDKVSFDEMLFSFKTLKAENYWKDTSFLK